MPDFIPKDGFTPLAEEQKEEAAPQTEETKDIVDETQKEESDQKEETSEDVASEVSNEDDSEKVTEDDKKDTNAEEESSESSLKDDNNEEKPDETEEVKEEKETVEEETEEAKSNTISYKDLISAKNEAIEEYFEGDIDIDKFNFIDRLNLENTTEEDAIVYTYDLENPDATDFERDEHLKFMEILEDLDGVTEGSDKWDDYLEDNNLTARDVHKAESDYEKSLKNAERVLGGLKEDVESFNENFEINLAGQDDQKDNYIQSDEYKANVDAALSQFNNVPVSVKDKDGKDLFNINSDITSEESSKMAEILKNDNVVYSLWLDNEGKLNEDKMLSDINYLVSREKHLKLAYDEGVSLGKKDQIIEMDEIDNTGASGGERQRSKPSDSQDKAFNNAFN